MKRKICTLPHFKVSADDGSGKSKGSVVLMSNK